MVTARARRIAATATALLATLAGASTAQAADVQVSTTRFVDFIPFRSYIAFRAAPEERNDVTVTREDRTFVIRDSGAPLRSPDGSCEISADARTARCFVPELLGGVDIELRDGDDRGRNDFVGGGPEGFDDPDYNYVLDGGPGDDELTGSELGDELRGGAGNDRLSGRGGPDGLTDRAVDEVSHVNSGGTNVMSGGDGDDSIGGGEGDDTIDGGPGADRIGVTGATSRLFGGDGDDSLYVGPDGTHTVTGEQGDDELLRAAYPPTAGRSRAAFDGGPGRDRVLYVLHTDNGQTAPPESPGVTISLSSAQTTTGNGVAGQSDSLTGVEDAAGSDGRDTIAGSEDANRLSGGAGPDVIRGGGGADVLQGGGGGDAIDAVDGAADTVACADGPYRDAGDTAQTDPVDTLASCDEAPDTSPPDLSGTQVPRAIGLRRLRARGLTVRVASGDGSGNRATAVLSTRGGRRLSRASRVFTRRVALRLRPARGQVRGRRSLRLVLSVSDAAGNVATVRRTVRVR